MSLLESMKRWDEAISVGEVIMKESPYGLAKKGSCGILLGKIITNL